MISVDVHFVVVELPDRPIVICHRTALARWRSSQEGGLKMKVSDYRFELHRHLLFA